jgi:histidinol-phosphate aminotransferase
MSVMRVGRRLLEDVSLYSPNREPCAIDLSDNTNLWGASPAVMRAMSQSATTAPSRYPPVYADELKRAMGAYLGVDAARIATGCGSDDVLDATLRAFGEPGDIVAYAEPTFPMIPTFATINGLRPAAVRLRRGIVLDADTLIARRAAITYLCSPNNPTGAAFSADEMERVILGAAGIVIVDEAYAEFSGWSAVDLLRRTERLIVVRTMSKAFGLAGLRVGYAAATPWMAREIEKARGPYKVSAIANAAALAALGEGLDWMRDTVRLAAESRERLAERLRAMGLEPMPSDANFVLVPVPVNAEQVGRSMRRRGVAIRPFSLNRTFVRLNGNPAEEAIRITVGPWPMMEACLDALSASLAEQ